MSTTFRDICDAPAGQAEILQGNLAFAAGCVRGGVHAADGYPGTPSSEVIDKGLSQVQDLITVGWSVNEAVAAGVAHGHSLAGRDAVVTMKIPGLYQAADIFTSGAFFVQERGALIYYIASDFTPSSTQHTIDPRYLFKSCFVPVFEPRDHQEMYLAPTLAAEIGRQFRTQVVVMASGVLCHSEGLVRLLPAQKRAPVSMPESLHGFNVLPGLARKFYDQVMAERMPALEAMVASSPLNRWDRKNGKLGVITYGVNDLYVREVQAALGIEIDLLSLAFTNPLPMALIQEFYRSIKGPVFVIEDGYRYLQEAMESAGLKVEGKPPYSTITEWSPALITENLGLQKTIHPAVAAPVVRPPVICAGCPYRLIANEIAFLRKKKEVETVFGDIGCNTLLYYMDALDTAQAMGASESNRSGYVLSHPEKAGKVLSLLGDSTECHTGLAATRNAVYRNIPGVKIILDNEWTAMTGGQPSPTSPANLAGQKIGFDLPATLQTHGAKVIVMDAFDKKAIRNGLRLALADAARGVFSTLVVRNGACLQKLPASSQRVTVTAEDCKKCDACLVCPGLEIDEDRVPFANNLCSGCAGHVPACVQSCPTNVLKVIDLKDLNRVPAAVFKTPPENIEAPSLSPIEIPARLSLAIRGVGGQGNLFFGHVLAQLALLAGYGRQNILKGETHGMAQMGGPVISTFSCGLVASPVLLPGTADCLIAMEKSEVLRPGFLEMLRPGGTVLLSRTQINPFGLPLNQYPTDEAIAACLSGLHVIQVDVLGQSQKLGDTIGKTANVVMMGILSTLPPFNALPAELWLQALKRTNSKPAVWAANYAAFQAGREYARELSALPDR